MIIGITGNSASGKGIICNCLKPYATIIIDADKIGYFLFQKYKNKLLKIFNINSREALSDFVFTNPMIRLKLNSILHPPLIRIIKKIIEHHRHETIIIDCALLFLFRLEFFCDYVIAPYCKDEIRMDRLIKYRKMNPKKAEKMVNSQDNILLYKKHIHFLIDNNSTKKKFIASINEILNVTIQTP